MPTEGGFAETMVPPWLYQPDRPFQVIAFNTEDMRIIALHHFDGFEEAMAWFVRFYIGPISGRSAGILDANNQILVGYMRTWETEWFGTEMGFAGLTEHHDPMSVAVWEVEAQAGRPHPTHIPEDIVP